MTSTPPPPQPIPSAAPAAGGAESKERKRVGVPSLPKVYSASDRADIARVLALIEHETVEKGGVPRDFAERISGRLFDRLQQKSGPVEIFPSAVYYFIVREAALGHGRALAADNLRNAHFEGGLTRFRELPQKTVNLK